MDERLKALESFKSATNTQLTEILLLIFIILFLVLVFIAIIYFRKTIKARFLKKFFYKNAKEKGLSDRIIDILWKYSKKLNRDPFLSLEVKASFEKVIDQYVNENQNYDEELIKESRKKLGFDYIPPFVPLTSTKDIELFQGGRLNYQNQTFPVSLYDKDEKYMYWLLVDVVSPPDLKGKRVKIIFLRRDDAIYTLEGEVSDIVKEGGKVILQIPHHIDMKRTQRRQYARVEIDIPVRTKILSEVKPQIITAEGRDISAGGIRICIPQDKRKTTGIGVGTELEIDFELDGKKLKINGQVVNIVERKNTVCYGIKFKNIKPSDEAFILKFVKKKQQKLKELIKNKFG
ncbi:PilZ domain-containing protein [Persephonella sp.]|uniref:flagellar brake protein n=1 Tax=Persephonella sp. TaxID=2060922 RepID=UPI002614B2FD|nr:PilZ domain-containing protein [Persephonella sp.]